MKGSMIFVKYRNIKFYGVRSFSILLPRIFKKRCPNICRIRFLSDGDYSPKKFGVFKEKEADDISHLVNNFTAPALAKALREREETLHTCAQLTESKSYEELEHLMKPYLKSSLEKNRRKKNVLDLNGPFTRNELVVLQRYLHRIPRQVFQPVEKRASVVIPLCNVNGIASMLFERRSSTVRTYKHQACFPGGMFDEGVDSTIIQTSLREMYEELGIPPQAIDVLGILRCDWGEVASMTGIAVTPVVGFIGEINDLKITPNAAEVTILFIGLLYYSFILNIIYVIYIL